MAHRFIPDHLINCFFQFRICAAAAQLDALLDAGIDAINISLDTLDPELFKKVARRDGHGLDISAPVLQSR